MEVILLEKIRNLGALGDLVTVKPGFARNFLIPQKKAVRATKMNVEKFEARRAELEARAKEIFDKAQTRADSLSNIAITLVAKASDEGKLFGSVGTREIAEAISEKGTPVEKSEVVLPSGALRELGEYEIDVQLHSDITVKVSVTLTTE